jgi:hypothetical protein
MADLLGKTEDGKYYPNGEWWMYKYYAEMEGERAETQVAEDVNFDVFATIGDGVVKVLAGTRTYELKPEVGDYVLEVNGLDSALGLDPFARVSVQTYRFDYEGPFGELGPPADLGTEDYGLSDGSVSYKERPGVDEVGSLTFAPFSFVSSTAPPATRRLTPSNSSIKETTNDERKDYGKK